MCKTGIEICKMEVENEDLNEVPLVLRHLLQTLLEENADNHVVELAY